MEQNTKCNSLPDFPILGGISGHFTAIYNDKLFVVGGCNFPDDSGQKKFYNDIYYLEIANNKNSQWVKAGVFPYEVAYGVSIPVSDGVICVGGENGNSLIDAVTFISFDNKEQNIIIKNLPQLPIPLSNASGTTIKNKIYIAGGLGNKSIYTLDLDSPTSVWEIINTNQEYERQQPLVFAQNEELFMTGGYDEKQAKVFTDIVKFDFEKQAWKQYDNILFHDGIPTTFIGAASANVAENNTIFAGGVNQERFLSALERIKRSSQATKENNESLMAHFSQLKMEYLSQPIDWYKFRTSLSAYDAKNKIWSSYGDYPELAKAGAGIALGNNKLYVVCGEVKPGMRTQDVKYIDLSSINSQK